jgi:hypothetical protein
LEGHLVRHLKRLLATRERQALAGAAALALLLGAVAVGYMLAGSDGSAPAAPVQDATVALTPPLTPIPTASPTASPTPEPTPEPTPPPYDGAIARLSVPRLGINNYIEPVAVIANQMQAPSDGVYAIGWYYDYAKPGWGENAVFSAHETWNLNHGPFYALHLAVPGDLIVVTMDNGIQYRDEVMTDVRYDELHHPDGRGRVAEPATARRGMDHAHHLRRAHRT